MLNRSVSMLSHLRIPLLLVAGTLIACGGDDTDDSGTDVGTDIGADVGTDSGEDTGTDTTTDTIDDSDVGTDVVEDTAGDVGTDVEIGPDGFEVCDVSAASDDLLVQGDYYVSLSVVPLGGLRVNMRANVVASADSVLQFELWSLSPDGEWESEAPVLRVCDLAVDSDGMFGFDVDVMTIPAQGTTTGVEVDVTDVTFEGELLDTTNFCGAAYGDVDLLGFNLDGSPFRGVTLGTQSDPPMATCEVEEVVFYDHIDACPTLVDGDNTMLSAELDRSFTLVVPEDATDDMPIMFVHHGLGGQSEGMLEYSGFDDYDFGEPVILVVPDGARDSDGEQVFPVDWNTLAAQYDMDNQDLVFFDDMLNCVSAQFSVDSDRVYVTGMSAGGLMTTFLAAHRADVIAAVAPMSGGYLQTWPTPAIKTPMLISWGGESDTAVGTNFNDLALELIDNVDVEGYDYATCDHGAGHTWPGEMTSAVWAWLSVQELGVVSEAYPGGLSDDFPEYCTYPSRQR